MSIFVGNISKNVRSRDLDDEFDKFGPCNINYKVIANIIRFHKNQYQGSYAFITFESEADAEDALNELQGKNMGGLKINICKLFLFHEILILLRMEQKIGKIRSISKQTSTQKKQRVNRVLHMRGTRSLCSRVLLASIQVMKREVIFCRSLVHF